MEILYGARECGKCGLGPITQECAAEACEYHTAHAVESTLPVRLRQVGGEAAAGQRIEHVERRFDAKEGRDQYRELRRPGRIGCDELREKGGSEDQQLGIADADQKAATIERD